MGTMMRNAAFCCKIKVDNWFRRVFKEQAGGAELIATIVIIGIVLILAFMFKDNLLKLVGSLWNSIVKGGNKDIKQSDVVSDWE